MSRTSPVRGALVACAAVILAACGSTAPTPVPSATTSPTASAAPGSPTPAPSATSGGDAAAVYAAIEDQVRGIRGLDEQTPVEPTLMDEDALSDYVRTSFVEDNPPDYVDQYERLLKRLGLVEPDADVEELFLQLLESQVVGLYDTDDKALYVVSRTGELGPTERVTYAHEYTHALQDQRFDLTSLGTDELDEGDRSIARTALVEGDATLVMSLWAQANLTPEELLQLAQEAGDPEQMAVLERMPPILREPLQFPYTAGLNLVLGHQAEGGWGAIDDAYASPPDSTEQILHPDKRDEAPIDVTFPSDLAARLGSGWTNVLEDTLGEFQLTIWLQAPGGLGVVAAGDAAAGWGGDRVVSLEGPDGAWATVLDTAWDSPADAAEFEAGADGAATTLEAGGSAADVFAPEPTRRVLVIADSPDTAGRVANVLGLAG